MSKPLLSDVGILSLLPDRYSQRWMSRHQLLTRLAHYFQVVWVNPAKEWRTLVASGGNREGIEDACPAPGGFQVYDPPAWLPRLYRPEWLAKRLEEKRLMSARRLLLDNGCRKFVLSIWRPEFAAALQFVDADISCYHMVDEYYFSPTEVPLGASERSLIIGVNQVFVSSPALFDKKGHLNPNTAVIPNGVDFGAFSSPVPEPADLARIPRPRIGYVGYLKRTLDWPLLLQLARKHTECSFVLVGSVLEHPEIMQAVKMLSECSNTYLLGTKRTDELSAYPQHFDVCIMPYQVNDYTKYIYPLKLHEYLAGGQPVVGARIRSLQEYDDVVELPTNLEEWSAAVMRALSPMENTPERRDQRRAIARLHDWELLACRVARILARRLGAQYAERLEPALRVAEIKSLASSQGPAEVVLDDANGH